MMMEVPETNTFIATVAGIVGVLGGGPVVVSWVMKLWSKTRGDLADGGASAASSGANQATINMLLAQIADVNARMDKMRTDFDAELAKRLDFQKALADTRIELANSQAAAERLRERVALLEKQIHDLGHEPE